MMPEKKTGEYEVRDTRQKNDVRRERKRKDKTRSNWVTLRVQSRTVKTISVRNISEQYQNSKNDCSQKYQWSKISTVSTVSIRNNQ